MNYPLGNLCSGISLLVVGIYCRNVSRTTRGMIRAACHQFHRDIKYVVGRAGRRAKRLNILRQLAVLNVMEAERRARQQPFLFEALCLLNNILNPVTVDLGLHCDRGFLRVVTSLN